MSYREYKFSELCTITRGASPRPIHDYLAKEGMPWIKISDATAEKSPYIRGTKECIKQEGVKASVKVYKGDLILSNSATPGLPKFLGIDACIHDGWMLLRDFKNITKEYAYWLLLAERTKLVAQGNGSVFTNLKTDILKNHVVKVPDNQTQLRVVNIIGTIQKKISVIEDTNQTLEAIAQTIFKSWFVNFDPVHAKQKGLPCVGIDAETAELFPDSFEDSELGLIPKGWHISTVDKTYKLTMGQSPAGVDLNTLGNGIEFYQGRTDFGFRYPTQRVFCVSPTRIAKENDILISVRAPVGDVNVALNECCIGRGVAAIRHPLSFQSFALYQVKQLKEMFKIYDGEGTVFGSISKTDFENIKLIAPSPKLAEIFQRLISPIDDRIKLNENQILDLSRIRDTLLPRLICGKLDVSAVEAQLEEMA